MMQYKMILFALSAFSVAVFGLSVAEEFTLPVCKRNAADYNACLLRAIQESFPRFMEDIPEFDWQGLDPFRYEYGKFIVDIGIIRGEVICTNITAIGVKTTQFFDARAYFLNDTFHVDIEARIPKLLSNGYCKAEVDLGVFKINSKGYFNSSEENLSGTWNITGRVENDRWIVERFQINSTVEKFTFYTESLFGKDKKINELAVSFVNEFFPLLDRIVTPVMIKYIDPWLSNLCNRFFSNVSFSKLFPEN